MISRIPDTLSYKISHPCLKVVCTFHFLHSYCYHNIICHIHQLHFPKILKGALQVQCFCTYWYTQFVETGNCPNLLHRSIIDVQMHYHSLIDTGHFKIYHFSTSNVFALKDIKETCHFMNFVFHLRHNSIK